MSRPFGNRLRCFFIALACTWLALAAAAVYFGRMHPDFRWIWTAAIPAFFLETLFYLSSVFENTRSTWWARNLGGKWRTAAVLWVTAVLPFLVFTLAAGTLVRNAFYLLAGLTAVFCFWHAVLPRRAAYDVGFLVIAAAPLLTHFFSRLYRSPDPHLRVDILGHLMWIRVGVIALLVLREWDAGPVSLWPRANEWREGVLWFGASLIPVSVLALSLHGAEWSPHLDPWSRAAGSAVGTFVGAFAVLALGEELFFRGVILRAVRNYSGSTIASLVISSVMYGAAHLWWRRYPNWQWALVTAVLGVFCGMAYVRTGSIRASMVTHALTVTVWRLLYV